MKRISRFHKNNAGSTLAIVLTTVAFLAILAVVVTKAASVNYKMKMINEQSQKAFYTAEDAVDELYAALGKASMECFDEAYQEEVSSIVKQTQIGGHNLTYTLSSMATNQSLRKNFTCRLVHKLQLIDTMPADKYDTAAYVNAYQTPEQLEKFVALLNSYLESKEGLRVCEVGSISVIEGNSTVNGLKNYVLTFGDCHVKYLSGDKYYSDIYFDGDVAMPDIYIDFATDANNMLKTFTNYALIGNTGVCVESGKGLNLKGNMYAGKRHGLFVDTDAKFLSSSDITIVSGGDIEVKDANFTANASNIWCNSLMVSGGAEDKNAEVAVDGSLYVKDDLQVDADKSKVTISGDYYGYSYQGFNTTEGNHNNSSAIIVNGEQSVLNLSGIRSLIIGGRAYIDYKTADKNYTTGESLSFMGSQEMYLIPSYLMSHSNPVPLSAAEVTVNITADNFFGYSYLKEGLSYTTRTVGNSTYYYLNFKDDIAAKDYVKALFDNAAYDRLKEGKSEETVKAYDKSRAYIQSVVNANINALGSEVISVSGSANVYTNGQMINAIQTDGKLSAVLGGSDGEYSVMENGLTSDGFALDAWDLSNRYSLMTRILAAPDWTKPDGSRNYLKNEAANKYNINGEIVDVSDYAENNMFANIISVEAFSKLLGADKEYMKEAEGGILLYAVDNTAPLIISNEESSDFKNFSNGIVVAAGDVILKKDFKGMILAGGKIMVQEPNVSVANSMDSGTVESVLSTDANKEFANIFRAYRPKVSEEDAQIQLEDMSFKDFVEFSEWRKSL